MRWPESGWLEMRILEACRSAQCDPRDMSFLVAFRSAQCNPRDMSFLAAFRSAQCFERGVRECVKVRTTCDPHSVRL